MNPNLILLAMLVPAVLLAAALYWADRVRRREALYRWSAENGLKLLSFRQPLLTELSGFPLSLSKAQHVFRVDVEESNGRCRSGWVRFGSAWLGLWSRRVDVRWDGPE